MRVLAAVATFVLCSATLPGAALASAFLEPEGEGLLILATRFDRSSAYYDARGKALPISAYRKFEISPYIEYGVTDWFTAIAQPSLAATRASGPYGARFEGIGVGEFGGRVGIVELDEAVVAVQATVRTPLQARGLTAATIGDTTYAGDIRLMGATAFDIDALPVFAAVEVGYRVRGGGARDEIRIDATLGSHPWPSLTLLAQTFSVFTQGPGGVYFPKMHAHKAEVSAVYHLTEEWSVQAGVFSTLFAQNARLERGAVTAVWYKF